MRIVLFGPPGAGKGTQARLLNERLHLQHIATGVALRAAIKAGTPVGEQAREFIEQGLLVPDGVVNDIIVEAIGQAAFRNFVLDGYPRTIDQAEYLHNLLQEYQAPLDAVVSLKVDHDVIVERLSRRRVNRLTGENYHLDFNPPPPDVDPDHIIQRRDDHPESIRKRLEVYEEETRPVKAYFSEHGLVRELDGLGPIEEVHDRIRFAIGAFA